MATVALTAALVGVPMPASASVHTFGPVSVKDDPSLAAAQQILSLIPQGDRERCQQIDPTDAVGDEHQAATAGVFCGDPLDPAATTVLYYRYTTTAKLNRDYLRSVPDGTPKSSDTDHSLCDGTNTWRFTDHARGGKDACFMVGGTTPRMVWTADRALLLGLAEGVDPSDGTALKKWWNGSAGPLEHAAKVTNFGTGTTKQYRCSDHQQREADLDQQAALGDAVHDQATITSNGNNSTSRARRGPASMAISHERTSVVSTSSPNTMSPITPSWKYMSTQASCACR